MLTKFKQAWKQWRQNRDLYHQELRAIYIAESAHSGQVRKRGGLYIYHPLRVAEYLRKNMRGKQIAERLQAQIIQTAILHDTIEDSDGRVTTNTLLWAEFDKDVVEAVHVLTKPIKTVRSVSYANYLSIVAHNPIATVVKIADMIDNMADGPTRRQLVKYSKGLEFLLDHSQDHPETDKLVRIIFDQP